MKVKNIGISFLGIIIIFIMMIGAIFPSTTQSVYAQDLSTETATPDSFLLETPYPPIIGTDTIPPNLPTETNIDTSTPLPEIPTLTQTPEPTYTETQLPTETLVIPTDDFHWKVSIEVPIQSADLQSFGGVSGAETHLENTLQTEITDQGVEFDVNTTRITNTSATYVVELEGNGGIDQFIQTIYSDLNEQLNLLNGPIQLRITFYIQSGQIIPVILESNITTGYLWELVNFDTSMLEKQGKPLFEQKMNGIGAPSKEMITLRAIADGMTTITINYRQPFDRGERQTRFIDLTDGIMPDVIDLSNPFQISSSLPSAPITSDAAPELLTTDPVLSLPATFDWKAEGKTTAVRDQGSCGSCWAFGTVGAMESAILIQSGQAVDLSEQFLVSCNASGWSCGGGWWAHNYHKSTLANLQSVVGAVLEADMPYTASNGTCRTITNHPYKLTNWYSIAGNTIPTVDQIKNAISTYGPVAAAICVGPGFSGYHSGVFSTNEASSCSSTVNHAIVLTGWDDATQSWVLRNSWGPNWGEAGYMRIKWGTSNVGYAANYVVYTAGATPTPGGPTETNTPVPQAPANDDINSPVDMSLANNVFSGNQNITAATIASDDPVFSCVAGKGYKSVWYRYTATQSGSININTTGSEYDTVLAVWQGNRGALTSIACNDDVATGQTQSMINLNITSGQVYYIEAAGYYSSASGQLYITLSFNPTENTYTISGTISGNLPPNTGVPSVTLGYTDGTPKVAHTDDFGNYSLSVPYGWTGTVTPVRTGVLFTPANATYTNITGNMTQNYVRQQPTFGDVSFTYSETYGGTNYQLFPYVQALFNAGFTNGCQITPTNLYCPVMILSRAQTAKFLLNVNHGAGYLVPPLPVPSVFTDVWNPDNLGGDGSWAWPWAEQLFVEGLTNGCQGLPNRMYCPWRGLIRVEAAKFALTMKYGGSYLPPPSSGTMLADISCKENNLPGDPCWGTPWAEQAYRDGLLVACGVQAGKPMFCPNDSLDRAWTAYMIVKAKNLPPVPYP